MENRSWNLTKWHLAEATLRAEAEEKAALERRAKNLKEQIFDGKVSPLEVTYMQIAKDLSVLDQMQPLTREPDMHGTLLLWQGREMTKKETDPKAHLRSPEHRILKRANGTLLFQKKRGNGWVDEPSFKLPPFFRKKQQVEWVNASSVASVRQDSQRNTVVVWR
jgi:hypothetical protein